LALFGLTLGYVLLIPYFGFTITTFLFLFSAKRLVLAASLAVMISLAGYLLFIVAFGTRFPRGPFEELMRGIM